MYQGGTFLRRLYRNKPKQYGPWKFVHASIRENFERIGINFSDVALAMPMWNPGDQRDYSIQNQPGELIGSSISWGNGLLNNTGDNLSDRVNLGSITSIDKLSGVPTGELTVISKVNWDGTSTNGFMRLIDKSDGGSGVNGWSVTYDHGAGIDLHINGSPVAGNLGGDFLNDNKFHTIGLSFKSGEQLLYDNGLLKESDSAAFTHSSATTNAAIMNWNHDADRNWLGDMSYILVFSCVVISNQIASLSDNPWQLWQPRAPVFYSVPDTGGSTLLPILLTDNLVSMVGKKSNTGSVNMIAGSADIDNSGKEGLNSILQSNTDDLINELTGNKGFNSVASIDIENISNFLSGHEGKTGSISINIDLIISLLGFESQVIFSGVLDMSLGDNIISTLGNKGLTGSIDLNIENLLNFLIGIKGNTGQVDINIFTDVELFAKLGITGILKSEIDALNLKLIQVTISGRIHNILISMKTGQIRIMAPKTGTINITKF